MLYEILKTAKLGTAAAPDMFTGLLAQKMKFAKGSGEIAELSGVPPLRFKSNGKPLLDWQITGNTVQNGTPTPTNPVFVQGVGELDGGQYKIPISNGQQTTNIYLGSTQTVRAIKKLVLDGTENWSEQPCFIGYRFYLPITSATQSDRDVGVRSMCTHQVLTTKGNTYNTLGTYTITGSSGLFMTLDGDTRLASWKSWLAAQYANGTPVTVLYVLTTPETAAVNEPLMKIGTYADTISMTDTGISIPTVHGNNVLTVDTTVQPSEVYIKYQK